MSLQVYIELIDTYQAQNAIMQNKTADAYIEIHTIGQMHCLVRVIANEAIVTG